MGEAIAGAIIENGKLLIVLKKESWILPGGKPEEGESDLACLARGFREELSGTKINIKSAQLYGFFDGISPINFKFLFGLESEYNPKVFPVKLLFLNKPQRLP